MLKLFQRYDLDKSGTINSVQEAEQLMFNVMVTHGTSAKVPKLLPVLTHA